MGNYERLQLCLQMSLKKSIEMQNKIWALNNLPVVVGCDKSSFFALKIYSFKTFDLRFADLKGIDLKTGAIINFKTEQEIIDYVEAEHN